MSSIQVLHLGSGAYAWLTKILHCGNKQVYSTLPFLCHSDLPNFIVPFISWISYMPFVVILFLFSVIFSSVQISGGIRSVSHGCSSDSETHRAFIFKKSLLTSVTLSSTVSKNLEQSLSPHTFHWQAKFLEWDQSFIFISNVSSNLSIFKYCKLHLPWMPGQDFF